MADEKKDILDEVREIERMTKRALLLKQLSKVKKLARERLEIQERCKLLLAQIGYNEGDIKRIIDFVNELPEVQLSDQDIKDLKDEIKEDLREERQETARKMEKVIEEKPWLPLTGVLTTLSGHTSLPESHSGQLTGQVFADNTYRMDSTVQLTSSNGKTLSIGI